MSYKEDRLTSNTRLQVCIISRCCSTRHPWESVYTGTFWQLAFAYIRQREASDNLYCIPDNINLKEDTTYKHRRFYILPCRAAKAICTSITTAAHSSILPYRDSQIPEEQGEVLASRVSSNHKPMITHVISQPEASQLRHAQIFIIVKWQSTAKTY